MASLACGLILLLISVSWHPATSENDRSHARATSRCCGDENCSSGSNRKYAFVTSIRTPSYMTGLRELHCSLQLSNPGVPLIVMGVSGDLDDELISDIRSFAEYRTVEDIWLPSNHTQHARFARNWVKLRAWEWTEYNALIMLDADTTVLRTLKHLFSLPADFAWAPFQGPDNWGWNAGGMIFLRPCQKMFKRMLHIIHTDDTAIVGRYAEQDFLQQMFRYSAMHLPMAYNLNFNFLHNGADPSGQMPYVVHFADHKPFNATPASDEWPYLCWQPLQHAQRSA